MKQKLLVYSLLFLFLNMLWFSACKEEEVSVNTTQSTANTVVHFSPFGTWQETSNMNVDSDGNVYCLMVSPGGTPMSANGSTEFFPEHSRNLVKLDGDGFLVWQKEVPAILEDTKLYIDNQDNVFVKNNGGLLKFDPDGNMEEIAFTQTQSDISGLDIDAEGNYYLSSGWLSWGSPQNSNFNIIQKYSADGTLTWENNSDHIRDIRLSKNGNSLYVLSNNEMGKYQSSNYTKEWSLEGLFEYGTSFLDVDEEGSLYLVFLKGEPFQDGNVSASKSSTIIQKYDTFGNLLFEKRIEADRINYIPRGFNVREGSLYLAIHSDEMFGGNTAFGNPVSHGSFIVKLDSENGNEMWRQYPQSQERQLSVYTLTTNDEGPIWTGFVFHLTWRAAEDYYVNSSFGDINHEQVFKPTGGTKYNLAALKP